MATTPKTGNEPFVVAGRALPFRLADFWRWSASDLLGNANRGVLAEFIVGRALGLDGAEPRVEWDAVDLRTPEGLKVEVKSAAYLQTWAQSAPSKIIFGIAPAKQPWDATTNTALNEPGRQADVYVFCLFREKDRERADPLDLDQWVFFVLPTRVLDEKLGDQKTVGLGTLERIGAQPCTFDELRETVGRAAVQEAVFVPAAIPSVQSRFLGCLLGGAVGDALGAPVEFLSLTEIRRAFGSNGVTGMEPAFGRCGAITDDTQMTLFTAEGLIRAARRFADRGLCAPAVVVHRAYLRWLHTQGVPWKEIDPDGKDEPDGWLVRERVLHHRRAPGNSCLSALSSGRMGTPDEPINDSKGCGGVMRVAPAGLVSNDPFHLGSVCAAITHGHPTGHLAAGALATIVSRILRGDGLEESCRNALEELASCAGHEETTRAIEAALALAETTPPSPEAVESLGQGWVAEEALAISLYCALTAPDFRSGVLTAVNHGGDSDSTGAITGNLLGCLWGVEAIPAEWPLQLEARDVIERLARDLSRSVSARDLEEMEDYPTY